MNELFVISSSLVSIVITIFCFIVMRRSSKPKARSLFIVVVMHVIWICYLLLYNLGTIFLELPEAKHSEVATYICIFINILSCLYIPVILRIRSNERIIWINPKIISFLVSSVFAFTLLWSAYNIYYFANFNPLAYFNDSSTIRLERFTFSSIGAPFIYSILEYLSYSFLPIAFILILCAQRNLVFKYLSIIFFCVIVISAINFSRTPTLIFFLTCLFSLTYRPDILSKLFKYIKPATIIGFMVLLFFVNVISSYRDDGVKNSFKIIKNIGIPLGNYNPLYGALFSNYLYIYTSINNLSDSINEKSINGLGINTFGPLVSFARKFYNSSELVSDDNIFELGGDTNRSIFGQAAFYNASTGFKSLIQDYGYPFGIIVIISLIYFVVAFAQIFPNSLILRFLYVVAGSWVFNSGFTNYFQSAGKAVLMGLFSIILLLLFTKSADKKRRKGGLK